MNSTIKTNTIQSEIKTFTDNAFFLLANHKRILDDDRMRYASVDVTNGLLYSGTSGFKNPVLGVYIEWWLTCKAALVCLDDNNPGLIWSLAGSPLSGCNSCSVVDESGNKHTARINDFHGAWTSFVHINSLYAGAKEQTEAYSISEAIEKLKADGDCKSADRTAVWALQQIFCGLRADNAALKKQIIHIQSECEKAYIISHIDEIRPIFDEIKVCKAALQHELELLQSRHREVKASQHSGEITPKEAQRQITSILKYKEDIHTEIMNIENEYTNRLKTIDQHITSAGVDAVLKEE